MLCSNLNQLKKAFKALPRFEIIDHHQKGFVGDIRQVTLTNTVSFYSVVEGQPEHKVSKANDGKGYALWWNKAPFWVFKDGICAIYKSDKVHDQEHLVMAFRILEKKEAV